MAGSSTESRSSGRSRRSSSTSKGHRSSSSSHRSSSSRDRRSSSKSGHSSSSRGRRSSSKSRRSRSTSHGSSRNGGLVLNFVNPSLMEGDGMDAMFRERMPPLPPSNPDENTTRTVRHRRRVFVAVIGTILVASTIALGVVLSKPSSAHSTIDATLGAFDDIDEEEVDYYTEEITGVNGTEITPFPTQLSKPPTAGPTTAPTQTKPPTVNALTDTPTKLPTGLPTTSPSDTRTYTPTSTPTGTLATLSPTADMPTTSSSASPTSVATISPSTGTPTTASPTGVNPTTKPTGAPSTENPSAAPTTMTPSVSPSNSPSTRPTTEMPSTSPTTMVPSARPTTATPSTSPTTKSPSTAIPSTTTRAPSTRMPSTSPSTMAPSMHPTTRSPSTLSPTTTTPIPSTNVPTWIPDATTKKPTTPTRSPTSTDAHIVTTAAPTSVLAPNPDIPSSSSQKTCPDLGDAAEFNGFFCGDYTNTVPGGDVQGRLAASGNFDGHEIRLVSNEPDVEEGQCIPGKFGLIVGGNAQITSGAKLALAHAVGGSTTGSAFNYPGCVDDASGALPPWWSFNNVCSYLSAESVRLGSSGYTSLAAVTTGVATKSGGTLIVPIDSTYPVNVVTINTDVPIGDAIDFVETNVGSVLQTVIVLIPGNGAIRLRGGFFWNGVQLGKDSTINQHILWNMPLVTSLTITTTLPGSVLAPNADISGFSYGVIAGQLIARSYVGSNLIEGNRPFMSLLMQPFTCDNVMT